MNLLRLFSSSSSSSGSGSSSVDLSTKEKKLSYDSPSATTTTTTTINIDDSKCSTPRLPSSFAFRLTPWKKRHYSETSVSKVQDLRVARNHERTDVVTSFCGLRRRRRSTRGSQRAAASETWLTMVDNRPRVVKFKLRHPFTNQETIFSAGSSEGFFTTEPPREKRRPTRFESSAAPVAKNLLRRMTTTASNLSLRRSWSQECLFDKRIDNKNDNDDDHDEAEYDDDDDHHDDEDEYDDDNYVDDDYGDFDLDEDD